MLKHRAQLSIKMNTNNEKVIKLLSIFQTYNVHVKNKR